MFDFGSNSKKKKYKRKRLPGWKPNPRKFQTEETVGLVRSKRSTIKTTSKTDPHQKTEQPTSENRTVHQHPTESSNKPQHGRQTITVDQHN